MAYGMATDTFAARASGRRLTSRRRFQQTTRNRRRSTVRFFLLFAVLNLTGAITTVVMFETLYWALG